MYPTWVLFRLLAVASGLQVDLLVRYPDPFLADGEAEPETYRPTSQHCLMRTVTNPNFCKVCKEELWKALLRRTRLIDNLYTRCVDSDRGNLRLLVAKLLPLAHLRPARAAYITESNHETYTVRWRKDGIAMHDLDNQTTVTVQDGLEATGNWTVEVLFKTDEVRVDPEGLLKDAGWVNVKERCV